jgi:hypothetical protein
MRERREPILAALIEQIEMQPDPAARLGIEGGGELGLQDDRAPVGIETEAPE